jgi:hypothetical protein
MNIDGRCHCGYIRFNRLLEDGSIDHPADTFCPPLITQDMHRPLVVAWR